MAEEKISVREKNYNERVKPHLEEIGFWVRDGRTMESIAESLGVPVRTLNDYKNEFAEFADILKKDKDYCDSTVINAVYKSAKGFTQTLHKRVYKYIYSPDGKLKEKKLVQEEENEIAFAPNPTAQKMWLNARKREEWGAITEAIEAESGGVVLIPESEIIDEPTEENK